MGPEGLLFVFIIFGLLLGTCLSEQACVDDACFDQSIQQLKIERSKIDQASGLNYRERSTDLVATIDVIGVCLPGVNPNVLADSFQSCSDEKDYDYLEESASRSRQRRAAGDNENGEKKAGNKNKNGQGKKKAKNNQKNAKKGGNGKGSKRNG